MGSLRCGGEASALKLASGKADAGERLLRVRWRTIQNTPAVRVEPDRIYSGIHGAS
jgi:hypothetical protein